MRTTVKLPRLSDTVDKVIVVGVVTSKGEYVKQGSPLIIVDADKADVEVPAPVDGLVLDVLVELDQEIATGSPIAVIQAP